MRIFKTETFERWAGKAGVTDGALLNAVAQMERGLIDADLGGNLFKQRVALPGRGKSGSTRTIAATRFAGVLFFLYGFERTNATTSAARSLRRSNWWRVRCSGWVCRPWPKPLNAENRRS